MTPDDALKTADTVLLTSTGSKLTDVQRLILRESLAGKGYEEMEGYTSQHLKNEGQTLWKLLSAALGEKVSKTSFKGALEKRWKLGELIPKQPLLSIYNPQTWVGRKAILQECLPKLQDQARVLWITGISGIGKTALGECLASEAWNTDPTFQWLYLEILEGQSRDFVAVVADLLAKLGDADLDPKERNDPKRLMERLLRKLQASRYWVQLDSLERLLDPEQPTETEFADGYWVTFLQRCLTEPSFASRLVLTAQALPTSLAELEDRYANLWQVITLQGLSAHQRDEPQTNEHLELFAKNGLTVDDVSSTHLRWIGQIYEGHPLVLQVIAKEILALPFDGNVASYWQRYGNEFEQVARELQVESISAELYNQALQKRVRRRVEISLKRLPSDAFDLLCRSSVYRRPVPESFWLSLLEEKASQLRQQAYQILSERALVEREGIHQNQFLIRQHNLVRAVAYDLLRVDTAVWEQAERQAAELWLQKYTPEPEASNLETIRGYLEAFEHFCNIEDWEGVKQIAWTRLQTPTQEYLCWQLESWGYFREAVLFHRKQLDLARKKNDTHEISAAMSLLGLAYYSLGQYQQAIEFHQQHLAIAREIGDRKGEGNALGNLGNAYYSLGQYQQAIEFHQQALIVSREIGDRRGEGQDLGNLGIAYNSLGQYQQAIELYQQHLAIAREIGNRQGEGNALGNLGIAYKNLGQYQQAIEFHQQALIVSREIGDRRGEGQDLGALGNAYYSLGQYQQAIEFHQQYLAIAREIGDRQGEGMAIGSLGATQFKLKQYSESLTHNQLALGIFREIGDRTNESEALKNLAELHQALGEIEVARQYGQQALALATELGIPLTADCSALLQELESQNEER